MINELRYIMDRASELGFSSRHLIQYINKDIKELTSYFIISPENKMLHIIYGIENAVKFNYYTKLECKRYPRRYHNEFIIRLDENESDDSYVVFKSFASSNVVVATSEEEEALVPLVNDLYHALDNNIRVTEIYNNNQLFTILEENDKLYFGPKPYVKLKYHKVAKEENFDITKEFSLVDSTLILDAFYLNLCLEGEASRLLVAVALDSNTKEIVLLRIYKHIINRDDILVGFYNEIISNKGVYQNLVLRDIFDVELLSEINDLFDVKVSVNDKILEIDKVVQVLEGSDKLDKLS